MFRLIEARLQTAAAGWKPVLPRVDYDGGHSGIGATRLQANTSAP